jgi:hypothetical protein
MLSTSDTSLTKVAWLRGNNGWNQSYRVPLLGATRPSLFDFRPSRHPSAGRTPPALVLSN